MHNFIKSAAVLLCVGTGALAFTTAHASGCSVTELRLGLIGQGDCLISPEEVVRGLDLYKARHNGIYIYAMKTAPKPNLVPYNISEFNSGGNAVMDAKAHVRNSGMGDVGRAFDVRISIEFVKLDDNSRTQSPPVTVRMNPLAAGASASSDWISSISYILIPDPDPDYDAVITATVDPGNVIDESDETDNVYTEVCRIPGYGDGQARPLAQGEDYC